MMMICNNNLKNIIIITVYYYLWIMYWNANLFIFIFKIMIIGINGILVNKISDFVY